MYNDQQATWVSNSSINDFLKCPRAYYLKNIYKDPQSHKKISLISPPLVKGLVVHRVIDYISRLKREERLLFPFMLKFDELWKQYSGERGGFQNIDEEDLFKNKGKQMLQRVIDHPGPLLNPAIKIHPLDPSFDLLYYTLSKKENIILCGNIDWIEYLPDSDSLHIIDFKTGKNEEGPESLQLLIYLLLVHNLQKRQIPRQVSKIGYWYLDRENAPTEELLLTPEEAYEKIFNVAIMVKDLRKTKRFNCIKNGCFACSPYEEILQNKSKYIGVIEGKDTYIKIRDLNNLTSQLSSNTI